MAPDPITVEAEGLTAEEIAAREAEETEKAARAHGWVPEEEWKGKEPPPGGFVTAEAFVNRTPTGLAKALKAEIATLRSELTEIRASADSFRGFSQRAIERERREKQEALQRLEQRRAEAISAGDGNATVATEREIAQVRSELADPGPQQPDPAALRIVQDFIRDNSWYEQNPHMRAWAEGRSVGLLQAGVPAGKAILDQIAKEARQVFPTEFAPKSRAATVEAGGRRQAPAFGRRTFDDLPDDAKRAYAEYKRLMPSFSKDEFLSQYEWD